MIVNLDLSELDDFTLVTLLRFANRNVSLIDLAVEIAEYLNCYRGCCYRIDRCKYPPVYVE